MDWTLSGSLSVGHHATGRSTSHWLGFLWNESYSCHRRGHSCFASGLWSQRRHRGSKPKARTRGRFHIELMSPWVSAPQRMPVPSELAAMQKINRPSSGLLFLSSIIRIRQSNCDSNSGFQTRLYTADTLLAFAAAKRYLFPCRERPTGKSRPSAASQPSPSFQCVLRTVNSA